jgi:hypothetical protein
MEGGAVRHNFERDPDVKVSDIYFTEFGAAFTTVLPVLFKYCYKLGIF